jgi:hypothetical protein
MSGDNVLRWNKHLLTEYILRRPLHFAAEPGLRAKTFTPCTPNLRAVFSLVVPRKQSKRAVMRTSSKPICAKY